MTAVTIRDIPEDTRRAIDARAARNGRTTEAEILHILQAAVLPSGRSPAASAASRAPGALRGRIRMAPDFDETPEDLLAAMEGEAD